MQELMNDFQVFFSGIFSCLTSLWNWLISTTLGEIILFVVLISIFIFIINLFIDFKD